MSIDQKHLDNLIPEAREVLQSNNEDRIRYLRTRKFIMYGRAKEILSKLEDLMDEPKGSRMPCLLIVGDSHSGKTSIVEKLLRMHPPTDGIEEAAMPVVLISAPGTPDPNALLDRILKRLVLPFKKTDSITKKESEVEYHFVNLGVRILVIDEIHNILSGSVPKQKAFMNTLKNLCNEIRIPIVLVGTKDALHATDVDLQISSRFRPMLLPRWKLDSNYVSLLASIEKTVPLKKLSDLAKDKKLAEKILDLSEGLLGEIVYIITESGIRAIKTGAEAITLEIIEDYKFVKPSQTRGLEVLEA